MGISTTKSKTTPVYDKKIEGAGDTLTSAYNTNAPGIQKMTDSITGLMPGLIDKYKAGDPALNAANKYVTDTLGSQGQNPFLDQWIAQNQNDVSNQLGASLGKMGLGPAGTTYQALQARELGKVALGARVDDWNAAQARQAEAAGMATGLSAADSARLSPLLGVADVANNPLQAAVGYSAGMGGLLGQYTNTKTKNAWGPQLLQAASNAAAAYAGGG